MVTGHIAHSCILTLAACSNQMMLLLPSPGCGWCCPKIIVLPSLALFYVNSSISTLFPPDLRVTESIWPADEADFSCSHVLSTTADPEVKIFKFIRTLRKIKLFIFVVVVVRFGMKAKNLLTYAAATCNRRNLQEHNGLNLLKSKPQPHSSNLGSISKL